MLCFCSWCIATSHTRDFIYIYIAMTHHTSGGVELAVGYAAKVAAAASVVFGAVSDGPEGVQQNLQRVKG